MKNIFCFAVKFFPRYIDQAVPTGETWHRDLRHQMACDVAKIRPDLIRQKSESILDESRRFRQSSCIMYTREFSPR